MSNEFIQSFRDSRWFYLFICVHLILWTAIPALIRYNLPLDSIEGTIWGHQLEWGYDKNPFLNGWLTALATYLGGQSGWMVYFFSQISVVVCFWAIWKLAKNMLPPIYALIAVMMLEGIQYYNFHAIDFNDNTLELGLWALTIYCFYQALCTKSKTSWILTGIFAGFSLMAKYYTATLLTAMVLFLFFHIENRKQLKTLAPYLGLIVFLAIILPHIIWLFYHDFITITYVFERGSSTPHWTNRFFYPTQFTWQQLQTFLPAIILYGLLFIGKNSTPSSETTLELSTFNRLFLLYVGLGPFLLTLLISLLLGTKLRAGWGMPLLSTWGIMLVAIIQPLITQAKVYRFIAAIFLLIGALITGYSVSLIYPSSPTSANFPGREIAHFITQQWHEKFHTKLAYVGGSRWLGGNISFYSPDHPAVFIEWDKHRAPWIDITKLEQSGAIFLWDMTENESLPDNIKERFPQLNASSSLEFSWLRNKNNLIPIKIGIAYLPPAKKDTNYAKNN